MKGRLKDLTFGSKGEQHITVTVTSDFRQSFDDLKDYEISVEIKRYREPRSKNANAYFHVLVNKIAEAQRLGNGEVKRQLVLEYGTLATDETGSVLGAMLPASASMILNTKPPEVEVANPELAYHPCKRTPKVIFEHGKFRKIYMPEIHEQWLHHIIVLVLEPIIRATAYRFSCGSFPQRGAHYGKRQIERWLQHNLKTTRNFAKVDIRHFYDSIQLKVLMRELAIRIKDRWFLYIIWLCLKDFKKGIPLGFYISQWLANYILEPVDRLLTKVLGFKETMRYMDDITIFGANKKKLHAAIVELKKLLGRRFRLKLKSNWQVCKFWYQGKKRTMGRPLDFMGFVFYRNRTVIRKRIMIKATRLASRMHRAKVAGRSFYKRHVSAMLSYIGWFSCTDTYGCYRDRIKPLVRIKSLKQIISKLQRRQNQNDRMETGALLQPT